MFFYFYFTKLGEDVGRHLAFGVAEGSDLGHIQLLQRLHLMLKKKVITTSSSLIPNMMILYVSKSLDLPA